MTENIFNKHPLVLSFPKMKRQNVKTEDLVQDITSSDKASSFLLWWETDNAEVFLWQKSSLNKFLKNVIVWPISVTYETKK